MIPNIKYIDGEKRFTCMKERPKQSTGGASVSEKGGLGGSGKLIVADKLTAEIYSEEPASSIFRQSSNNVCGSWKSQASSPWAKQHRV